MRGLNVATECPFRILATVTFHFRESRLKYLFQVIRALCEYPVDALDVVVVTNVEDDIVTSFDNFCYFVRYREALKDKRLIPSFQRIEYNDADNRLYLVDQLGACDLSARNHVDVDGYAFVNLDYPYNAMFILDREL